MSSLAQTLTLARSLTVNANTGILDQVMRESAFRPMRTLSFGGEKVASYRVNGLWRLSFGGHTFYITLIGIFLDCSHVNGDAALRVIFSVKL